MSSSQAPPAFSRKNCVRSCTISADDMDDSFLSLCILLSQSGQSESQDLLVLPDQLRAPGRTEARQNGCRQRLLQVEIGMASHVSL